MYIAISILIFGLLIAIHEFGHYIAAKSFGVGVPEFAIGMGPKLFKWQGKETLYTLRAIPLGGFCAMDGDDTEEAGDKSLYAKPIWQRLIIFLAGSFMNVVAGFVILLVLFSSVPVLGTTTVSEFVPGFPLEGENGFQVGDSFHRIGGHRVYQQGNIPLLLNLELEAGGTVDVVVIRDGERVTLSNLPLERRVFTEGEPPIYGFIFALNREPTGMDRLAYTWAVTRDFMRQLPLTLRMFTTGQAGMEDVSSVVGIVDTMNQVGTQAETVALAMWNFAFIAALISISVAMFNLLPIPALDGGRIFLMLIGWVVEKIFRRKLDPKYEAHINTAGFMLLIGLMIFIMYQDIVRIAARALGA
ncbi:MAG: site-2 protease family protein [Oscillospiraceae bacterium]|nr:site-2 protease family protein [Oscillospiraceae bacterium]